MVSATAALTQRIAPVRSTAFALNAANMIIDVMRCMLSKVLSPANTMQRVCRFTPLRFEWQRNDCRNR